VRLRSPVPFPLMMRRSNEPSTKAILVEFGDQTASCPLMWRFRRCEPLASTIAPPSPADASLKSKILFPSRDHAKS
jgi:hypothetical protein